MSNPPEASLARHDGPSVMRVVLGITGTVLVAGLVVSLIFWFATAVPLVYVSVFALLCAVIFLPAALVPGAPSFFLARRWLAPWVSGRPASALAAAISTVPGSCGAILALWVFIGMNEVLTAIAAGISISAGILVGIPLAWWLGGD